MANILKLYADILYLHGLYLHVQSSENQTLLLRFAFLQVTFLIKWESGWCPRRMESKQRPCCEIEVPAHCHCLFDE